MCFNGPMNSEQRKQAAAARDARIAAAKAVRRAAVAMATRNAARSAR